MLPNYFFRAEVNPAPTFKTLLTPLKFSVFIMSMNTNIYPCSQADLYTVCRTGWNNCMEKLNEFSSFSTQYNAAFVQQKLQDIDAAEGLANEQLRYTQAEMLRHQLELQADKCLKLWQMLKRHILKAFADPDDQETQIDAAGQALYARAAQKNWDSVQALMVAASQYLDIYEGNLQQTGMPATFKNDVVQNRQNFTQLHQQFIQEGEASMQKTADKILANNAIYRDLITMFEDGQILFDRTSPDFKQFSFDYILTNIVAVSSAGAKGFVLDKITNLPIANAQISLVNKNKTTTTDSDGRFEFGQLAVGEYNLNVKADGYLEQTLPFEVKASTTTRVDVALEK